MMEFDDPTFWTMAGAIIILLAKVAKDEIPKLLAHSRKQEVHEMLAEEQKLGEVRQDDVATFANMVALQERITKQNEKLIDYFINDLDRAIVELRNSVTSVEANLSEVDKRWLERHATAQQRTHDRRDAFDAQVERLLDGLKAFETRLTYALSCIPEATNEES